MAKMIYASEEKIQAHKSLTDVIGLQDLVIVGHEYDERRVDHQRPPRGAWSGVRCRDSVRVA